MSNFLTVLMFAFCIQATFLIGPSVFAGEKGPNHCPPLLSERGPQLFGQRWRQATNFQQERRLKQRLGDHWRHQLLTASELDYTDKNISNADLMYMVSELNLRPRSEPVRVLRLARNPELDRLDVVQSAIKAFQVKDELDISDLTLAPSDSAHEPTTLAMLIEDIIRYSPDLKVLKISHLMGSHLYQLRKMRALVKLDISNSHFRSPTGSLAARTHDPAGSISTERWLNFLQLPPPSLREVTHPPYFNNEDEHLKIAQVIATQKGITLNSQNIFSSVTIAAESWRPTKNMSLPLIVDEQPQFVSLQSTIIPPSHADNNEAKLISRAVSHFIYWHLIAADKIDLANVQFLPSGQLNANIKYRISGRWYSLARELERLGVPRSSQYALNSGHWVEVNWAYIYSRHRSEIDRWARAAL